MKHMTVTVTISADDNVRLPDPETIRDLLYNFAGDVMMFDVQLKSVIHRATPSVDLSRRVCVFCQEPIKAVPGTWVHEDTGLVAGYQKNVR